MIEFGPEMRAPLEHLEFADKGRAVVATSEIRQPPCAETDDGELAPDVPGGTRGVIEEIEEGQELMYWIRFPEPYGAVLCERYEFALVSS